MFSIDIGNLVGHLKLDDSMWNKTLRNAEAGIARAGKRIATASARYIKYGTVAATAYTVASVKVFASFEQQMQNVATMLDDQTMHYMPQFSKAIRDMSISFGESTETLSMGLYNVLSASIPVAEAIDVLNASVTAAKAGMTDTSTAAYAITGIINAYGMSAKDATKVSDILFATVKRGQTTFAQLAPSIGRVTSIAAVAGVKFEEIAAALSTITRAGISTDQAITFLRSSLIALQGKGEDNVKLARDYGIELSVSALKAEGLAGTLEKLNKLNDEQFKRIFTDIRSRQALVVLMQAQTGYMNDLNLTMNATGMTQEAYIKMTNTLSHTLRQLWQTVKMVSVEFGSRFSDSLKDITKYIIENKETIMDWAEILADRMVFVGEIFVDVFASLFSDFDANIRPVLKLILEAFIAFGKSIIEIGITAGKGFIHGIKTGIIGEGPVAQDEIKKAYEQIIKEAQERYGKNFKIEPDMFIYEGFDAIKVSKYHWQLAKMRAESERTTNYMNELFSGASENITKYFGEAFEKAAIGGSDFAKKLQDRLDELANKDLMREFIKSHRGWENAFKAYKGVSAITKDNLGYLENINEQYMIYNKQANEHVTLAGRIKIIYDEIKETLKSAWENFGKFLDETKNMAEGLGDAMISAFNNTADAITNLIVKGKADFRELASVILSDFLNAIIRAQMAAAAMELFPSLAGGEGQGAAAAAALTTAGMEVSGALTLAGTEAAAAIDIAGVGMSSAITIAGTEVATAISMAGATAGIGAAAKHGLVFNSGSIVPMAMGGIINAATLLPMVNNQTALVGEAGPEAVVPLTRTNTGDLGIRAQPLMTENKIKIINVNTKEQQLAAMQSEPGEKVIMNVLRKNGVI